MELYYQNPIVAGCIATVLDCRRTDGGYAVTLDKSPLFPEGGGQLSDDGSIDGFPVREAGQSGGRPILYCEKSFEIGQKVDVRLDISSRLDHSAQHTGEHILSGAAKRLFGAVNVGFHMAKDYCTIDLDRILTDDELEALEAAANAAVRQDAPVTTEIVSGDEAASRPLRKLADKLRGTSEPVRIVYIDGGNIDSCACCGTHLARTGEVGAILITDAQKYKGGVRLWFACGERAIRHARRLQTELTALARRYSTSREELPAAIEKQDSELSACRRELRQKAALCAELMSGELLRAAEYAGSCACIVKRLDNFTANDLKLLGDRLIAAAPASRELAALLISNGAAGCAYRMVSTPGVKLSMRELCAAVNAALAGKGGGGSAFAQGSSPRRASDEDIELLRGYLLRALEG